MSKLNIIGSVNQEKKLLSHMSVTDFDDKNFRCIALYCKRDGNPVPLSVSVNSSVTVYRVMDGTSEFYFKSYAKAEKFCDMHSYELKTRK